MQCSIIMIDRFRFIEMKTDPRVRQCTEALPTQRLKGIKMLMSIELSIYLLYWYFQQNQCLNIKKKHAVHNIH